MRFIVLQMNKTIKKSYYPKFLLHSLNANINDVLNKRSNFKMKQNS